MRTDPGDSDVEVRQCKGVAQNRQFRGWRIRNFMQLIKAQQVDGITGSREDQSSRSEEMNILSQQENGMAVLLRVSARTMVFLVQASFRAS